MVFNRDDKPGKFFAPISPFPNSSTDLSNPKSTSAIFLIPKYTKNNLQQILKIVLEFRTSVTLKNFDKTQKRLFKARPLNVYKNKFYIDCYNLI